MLDVTLPIAFLFGLISFLSPCVLPLVPAYISYLGGRMLYEADVSGGTLKNADIDVDASGQAVARRGLSGRFGLLMHGFAFVAGFTFVFVLLGVLTTALVQQIGGANINSVKDIIARLGGVLIIFFGLHFGGILPDVFARLRRIENPRAHGIFVAALAALGTVILLWGFAGRLTVWMPANAGVPAVLIQPLWPDILALAAVAGYLLLLWLGGAFTNPRGFMVKLTNTIDMALYADTRREMQADGPRGLVGSMLMGVVFSAGWSPCIGTVYGSILTMSSMTGDVARTSLQLTAYSFGLGIPFLLAAVAMDSVQGFFRKISRHMRKIKLVSGLLLVLIGILVASGKLQELSVQLSSGQFAAFSNTLENNALDTFNLNP